MTKIILDTDIGTDVDDVMALALILASPEFDVLGITTAYGDTRLRARLTHRVLQITGRTKIPVHAGVGATLNGVRTIFWPGHEGKNAGLESISEGVIAAGSAEDFILETVARHPGEITLLAIAPLGNVARAILKDPTTMRHVKQIVMMGGVFGMNDPELRLPATEHNIRSDPEAARIVFEAGIPITLFPLDVTTKAELHPRDVSEIGRSHTPLATFLHKELETWLGWVKEFQHRDYTHMHDPLATAWLLEPALATRTVTSAVRVECSGEYTSGATVALHHLEPRNVDIVLGVDAARFGRFFLERVTGVQPQ
jgi:purine nucleosidase